MASVSLSIDQIGARIMISLSPYSIAIPTYNRGDLLIRLLDKINSEFPDEVQVFIRDNCSQDKTLALVEEWINLHPKRSVSINRNEENIGIDKNILSVIQDCTTKWVKVFGDDDFFLPSLIPKITEFLISDYEEKTKLVFFNYCEITPTLENQITERQILIHDDRYYQSGCEIVTDVAESLPLLSALLLERDSFLLSAKLIPKHIEVGGVGFVWAILDMLRNSESIFYAQPLIQWANGEPERGFSWKRTVVVDFLWIVKDRCPKYLRRVKERTISNQITPRMRMLSSNGTSWTNRLTVLSFLMKYYWEVPNFWINSVPRAVAPYWLFRLRRFF